MDRGGLSSHDPRHGDGNIPGTGLSLSRTVRDELAGYRLSEHFGVGTGLEYFNLNVPANESGGALELDFQFFGPAVFGYATF